MRSMFRHKLRLSLLAGVSVVVCLHGTPAVTQPLMLEIASATAGFDQRTNEPIVLVRLTKDSGIAFSTFTTDRVGQTMELRRDGKLVSSPVIREPILGGSLQISGRFSVDQATEIASQLPAGSKIEVEAAVAH